MVTTTPETLLLASRFTVIWVLSETTAPGTVLSPYKDFFSEPSVTLKPQFLSSDSASCAVEPDIIRSRMWRVQSSFFVRLQDHTKSGAITTSAKNAADLFRLRQLCVISRHRYWGSSRAQTCGLGGSVCECIAVGGEWIVSNSGIVNGVRKIGHVVNDTTTGACVV